MADDSINPNSVNAFAIPAVDKSNHRYLLAVKEINDRAVACRRESDYESAIKNYNNALRIDRDSAALYNNRGVVHLEQNEFDLAISDFSRALKIEPAFAVAFFNRGRLRLDKGDEDRAIDDLKKSLKIDSKFSPAYRLL